jgi:hypothetical protein
MTAAFLEGSYGGDYTILSQNGDSVVILFKPSGVGVRDADVRLSFDDGTLFTMPIAGTGKDTGYKVAITPGSLFYRDSLLTCDSISRGLRFSISGCLIPGNYNASITGISAADYYAYFVGTDSVVVTFHPRGGGVRNAFFTLLFSDGKSFQIPLLGFGIDPGPALAATPDELFNGDSILTCRTLTKGFAVSSRLYYYQAIAECAYRHG